MMNAKRYVAFAALLIAISAQPNDRRPVAIDDQESLRFPSSPAISPDGRRIAYVDEERIYVVSGTTEPRAVTSESHSAWSPRWSGDGQFLYFLSDRSGQNQYWKLPVEGFGEAIKVTRRERGMPRGSLSPDEGRILLSLNDTEAANEASETDIAPPFVMTRRQFKRDAGEGYITAADTRHLYIYDIEADELLPLTSGTDNETSGTWSPDGETIAFVSDRQPVQDAGYRTDIWTVPAGGGEPRRLTDSNTQKSSPAFSPDGKHVAYLTAGDGVYSVPHIAIVPITGGEPTLLTAALDRWIGGFEFSADGRFIWFTFDNAGATQLARVRLSDQRIERVVEGDIQISDFDAGPGSTLAVVMNGRNDTGDIHRIDGSKRTRLTDLNAGYFREIAVGEKRKVSFRSSDGTPVEAFLTLPPDYREGGRYPAILNIHGGPVGQFSWGYEFRPQFWAAHGYVVIEPNPRGSTGFGEEYIRAIYKTWGITDYDDVIAAVDYAIEAGIADPGRLAVTGYSYGGYMTNIVITETNRFRAAASGAGHSLIAANFGHDIYQQWYVWELGLPWEERENYERLSPFLRAGRVETPTLFLGGRIDWNVPVLNAEL
ncbi:MAG: S9 family peptidase, partial [Gammaproteobacteria bacterium]|nr:S9 family peptidase [Gammaproteobacteria bacterium]